MVFLEGDGSGRSRVAAGLFERIAQDPRVGAGTRKGSGMGTHIMFAGLRSCSLGFMRFRVQGSGLIRVIL